MQKKLRKTLFLSKWCSMKIYEIKVTCEYYVNVEADSDDEALELAIDEEYDLSDLQNFYYEITGKENI